MTEPNTGLDTLKQRTTATVHGEKYRISGQKIWATAAQVASKMILLARTMPLEEVRKSCEGLSLFCIDFDPSKPGLELKKIKKMGGRAVDANEVFFDNCEVPMPSAVCWLKKLLVSDMLRWPKQLNTRVTGLSLGEPLDRIKHYRTHWLMLSCTSRPQSYPPTMLLSCTTTVERTTASAQRTIGVACNSAEHLAAEAAYATCERAVMNHGGMGYAMESDEERYLRECFAPRIAPTSREMILNFVSEKVLQLPRSY